MSDQVNKFKIKRFIWQFSLCVAVYAVVMGIIVENQPSCRGWFHDLKWTAELKIRGICAYYSSSEFDPETYPGEDSPQAKELQREIDEWYPQALERYPRLQVQYKNVPDEQNGFLKIIEWEEESKKKNDWADIPKEIYDLLDSIEEKLVVSSDEQQKIETFLNAKHDLVERAMAIGLLPDQSVRAISVERFIYPRLSKTSIDYLKVKAILEASRADGMATLQTLKAIRGWGDHYCSIETPNMLHITFGISIQLNLRHFSYSVVMPILSEKEVDYKQWFQIMKYEYDPEELWSHMIRGEWHSMLEVMIPRALPHENLRDPLAYMDAHIAFIDDLADPLKISHAGLTLKPTPKRLTASSRGMYEVLKYGLTDYGDGYRRAVTILRQYEVVFALRKLEAEGQDLSSLKEAAIESLPLHVFPDIHLSIDFDKRLVAPPKGKGANSKVKPLAF